MCSTVDALLPVLSLDPVDFWGEELARHAQVLVTKGADERRLQLEQLKTAAFGRLARMKEAGPALVELLAAEREFPEGEVDDRGDEHIEASQCPVCEYWGVLTGPVTRDDFSVVDSEYGAYWEVSRTWYPESFVCEVCGLTLPSTLLATAGFPVFETLEPEEATPEELEELNSEIQAEYEYERWHDERR